MSRSTQYIGLNKYAQSYVKNAKKTETHVMTQGMFGEDILGTIYYMSCPGNPDKTAKLIEEEQCSPWSSGPMIFTHLRCIILQDNGEDIDCGHYFSWMCDPSVRGKELDYETGRYYV